MIADKVVSASTGGPPARPRAVGRRAPTLGHSQSAASTLGGMHWSWLPERAADAPTSLVLTSNHEAGNQLAQDVAWCEGDHWIVVAVGVFTRVNKAVLVLNQNYEPLNVCNARRAVVLVIDGKAEVLETHDSVISTCSSSFPYPSVIRLVYLVKRPRPRVKLTRKEVFIRDRFTCQYCGRQSSDLTIDHIVPRSKGGVHSWDNLVSACRGCNHRKGGKTLGEARMALRRIPFEPSPGRYYTIERRIDARVYSAWEKFLPGLEFPELPDSTVRLSAD